MRLARLFLLPLFLTSPVAAAAEVTVFAAASLREAMDAVAAAWEEEATGGQVTISYAGSSALARQIEAGAPADVFVSANAEWMDALQDRGLLAAETRVDLFCNALVLIAPKGSPAIELGNLPAALGDERLAMALYDAVPAGIYGREALTALGLWDAVVDRVAQAHDVRGALALVATGEAPYGIVYATDAAAEPKVTVVAAFPSHSHREIRYPAAVTADGDRAEARAFLTFLQGREANEVFRRHGFVVR